MRNVLKIVLFSLFLISCSEKPKTNTISSKEIKANSTSQNKEFTNVFKEHFFIVGPNIDDNGNLELGCDCCSSEFYFCDDMNFIEVSYCMEGNDVLSGKYKPLKDGVEFEYNKKRLFIETDWETEIDSLKDKVVYSEVDNPISKEKRFWKKYDRRYYQTSNFDFAEKRDTSIAKHVKWLKEDSKIYDYLKKNIKSLNF